MGGLGKKRKILVNYPPGSYPVSNHRSEGLYSIQKMQSTENGGIMISLCHSKKIKWMLSTNYAKKVPIHHSRLKKSNKKNLAKLFNSNLTSECPKSRKLQKKYTLLNQTSIDFQIIKALPMSPNWFCTILPGSSQSVQVHWHPTWISYPWFKNRASSSNTPIRIISSSSTTIAAAK